ncbi:MAG: tyrosine--tRNA ligase [Bacilli bacterium]|nr:tyrosine--tRNA ligase [Bacilli bacterium]
MKFYDELKWRGLIKDEAGEDLEEKLNNGGLTFYIGADPSADSLHIGQFPTFLVAERLRRAGHKPIILVGGATGRVGDPRGTKEREKSDEKVVDNNFEKIKAQMKKLFGKETPVLNNYDWFKNYNYVDFLRDVGKYVNVAYMINKDLVKRQMESGISYAEFSYMLMQGYDFKHIFEEYGATLQFGGSDQWGNLTTGIELIRKLNNKEVYAFSVPLTVDSTGKKLGKSEGNALWLDKNKTSSYEMYQYLLNFEDSMIEEYLKKYTFLTKEEIENIMKEQNEHPETRIAQKTLAKEVITFIHDEDSYNSAVKISEALFSGNIKDLSEEELKDAMSGVDTYTIDTELNLVDTLVSTGILSSKREAREFITNGSISVNGEKITDLEYLVNKSNALYNKYIVIRRGKKKYYLVTIKEE